MIDVVIHVENSDDVFYRRPGTLARILALHDNGLPVVRSVVVIDASTGLTSTYRNDELMAAADTERVDATQEVSQPRPLPAIAAHSHHVAITHLGTLDAPDPNGDTEAYGAQISTCDEPDCTVFEFLHNDEVRRTMTPGYWELAWRRYGSGGTGFWSVRRVYVDLTRRGVKNQDTQNTRLDP